MTRRTLANPADAEAVLARLERLAPDARRRWGRMTAGEMCCHLADAFRTGLGEVTPNPLGVFGLRGALPKWLALSVPLPWPHGIPGPAEVDPRKQGTPPAGFIADRDRLRELTRRFIADVDDRHPHPMFGRMSRADWLRWGWLHLDHHLRQFGL